MPSPQVSERAKDAPASALRAMFASIGSFLSITDKLRGKSAAGKATAQPETKADAVAADPVTSDTVTSDTVTSDTVAEDTVTEDTVAEDTVTESAAAEPVVVEAVVTETVAVEPVVVETTAGEPVVVEPVVTETVVVEAVVTGDAAPDAGLPLANYDALTLPSLRARLRTLSAAQVGVLLAYEKSHADRGEIVTMFERRIAKLEAEAQG